MNLRSKIFFNPGKYVTIQLILSATLGCLLGMTMMFYILHQSKFAPFIASSIIESLYYPPNKILSLAPVPAEQNTITKKRICLVNIDNRPLQRFSTTEDGFKNMTFPSLASYSNFLYARLHGYDYRRIVAPPTHDHYQTWAKVSHLYDMVQSMSKSHDIILFLDSDAFVADVRMPIERLLAKWNFDDKAQLLLSLDVSEGNAKDSRGRTVLNTGMIFLRTRSAKVTAMLRNLSQCVDHTFGCEQWRYKWGHEQTAFSDYFRDAFISGVELLPIPCNEGLGFDRDPFNCHGIYISHVTQDKDSLKERYKQRLLYATMLILERELFLSHVTYPSTNDIDILERLRRNT